MNRPFTSSAASSHFPELPLDFLPIEFHDFQLPSDDVQKQRKGRQERPTECRVCGKAAAGFHYDVASCNGCKTFFKRQTIQKRSHECKRQRQCYDLTKHKEPPICRYCRFEKCKEVGMNPLFIQSDPKASKRELEEEEEDREEMLKITTRQALKLLNSTDDKMQKAIDMLTYLELKLEAFRISAFNPDWQRSRKLEDILTNGSHLGEADKAGPMPGWPLVNFKNGPPPAFPPKAGNPPPYRPDRKMWLFYNLMTTVEYAKTFMFFYQLDMRDRLVLIRHVALALMNLHVSYFTVMKKFDTIIQPDGSVPLPRSESHYAATVMSVAPLIRINIQKTHYVLLKAICLCNPAVPDLSHHAQEILAAERKKYADALFDNCLRSSGPAHYATLLGLMELLERQQRMQKDLHLLHIAPFVARTPVEDRIHVIEDIMNN